MLRFVYIIATSIILACIAIYRLSHVAADDRFSEEDRYAEAIRTIKLLKKKGKITTIADGIDNLPDNGGYLMYSNHQGKYDALGIMYAHKQPMSVLMDYKKSKVILTTQFIDALKGKRIKPDDPGSRYVYLMRLQRRLSREDGILFFRKAVIQITIISCRSFQTDVFGVL